MTSMPPTADSSNPTRLRSRSIPPRVPGRGGWPTRSGTFARNRAKGQDGSERWDGKRAESVEIATGDSESGWAQLVGGPCDGRLDPLEAETVELQVVMSDGQQHVYRRTDTRRESHGRMVVLFGWVGRQYGGSK